MSVYLGNDKVGVGYSVYDETSNLTTTFTLSNNQSSAKTTTLAFAKIDDSSPTIIKLNGVTQETINTAGNKSIQITIPQRVSTTIPRVSTVEVIGGSLANIEYQTVYLTTVNLGDNVISVRTFSFTGSSLTSVNISKTVVNIENVAFNHIAGIESFVVSEDNPIYDSRNNCNAVIEKSTNKLVFGCKNTVIPGTVAIIGENAFYSRTGFSSILLPSSIASIEDRAFFNCTNLTSINIPSSITSIAGNAFKGCSGLETIVVNNSNKKYDSRNNCNAIIETSTNKLICGCKNTTIPSSVVIIGSAFYNCTGLTSITIPNSVIIIEEDAFYGCTGLTSITMSNSIEIIGNNAFYGCNNSSLTSINLYDKLTSIGDSAFYQCNKITTITIPSSVNYIGDSAFSYTVGGMALTSITFMHTNLDELTMGENVFKVKSARSMTVNYYGNTTVANYNYSGDNITATLNLLS